MLESSGNRLFSFLCWTSAPATTTTAAASSRWKWAMKRTLQCEPWPTSSLWGRFVGSRVQRVHETRFAPRFFSRRQTAARVDESETHPPLKTSKLVWRVNTSKLHDCHLAIETQSKTLTTWNTFASRRACGFRATTRFYCQTSASLHFLFKAPSRTRGGYMLTAAARGLRRSTKQEFYKRVTSVQRHFGRGCCRSTCSTADVCASASKTSALRLFCAIVDVHRWGHDDANKWFICDKRPHEL